MKKKYFLYLCLLFVTISSAQDFSNLWKGHFSFLDIQDVSQGNDKIYAASENAIFIYDSLSQELSQVTTVEGLSGEYISTIHYSEFYELLIIGYESGLMDVYLEEEDQIITVVDIINKQNIPPDSKRINHFNERNEIVYISTDYGISEYDIERLEFGDTFYIGSGGMQSSISQTAILDGWIYASSLTTEGVKRAPIESENLINFNEWEQFVTGNQYSAIEVVSDQLYVSKQNRIINITNGILNEVGSFNTAILDLKSFDNNLLFVTNSNAYIYDASFFQVAQFNMPIEFDTEFTAITMNSYGVYIGTNSFGVLETNLSTPSSFIEIHPDGPLRNNPFSVTSSNNEVWVTYGDYSPTYNPAPMRRYGFSYLSDDEWRNTSYDSITDAVGEDVFNLNTIAINPLSPNQAFISSFHHGMLYLDNGEIQTLYNESNSALQSLILPNSPTYKSIRVSGINFDDNGIQWSLVSRVDRPLKSFNPSTGQWQSYSFTDIIPDGLTDELGFSDVEIGPDGTKWIGSRKNGVIAFNENGNQIKNIFDEAVANLPTTNVEALALDNRNQLWIGTIEGLRVLYNTSGFFDNNSVSTQPIIILDDGIPKELLESQYITDIKVDGSNNKWVGTIGAGVFYFTSDGQETIYHFTVDNSPLPSNNINEMSIDNVNGEVYFATDRGLVSFGSGGSKPNDSLEDAYIYPNPVRPEFDIVDKKVKIKDISENCNIKITDIEGNLVAEAQSRTNLRYKGYNLEIDGGTAYWNGKNLANNIVATGVYLVMISDLDNLETKVLKVMVVR